MEEYRLGEGVLEIKVDLDVNTAEPGPFATDDDEEITITVESLVFSLVLSKLTWGCDCTEFLP